MKRVWIDPPEGWLYGFPKLYNPEADGDREEWIYTQGYPRDKEIVWIRCWYEEDE